MAVSRDRRGRWGTWLVDQRRAHDNLTQQAVRDMLAKMGHPISEAYYGDFERGKSTPSADWQDVFGRLWGELPPPEPPPVYDGDQTDVAAAIDRQTAVMQLLVDELRAQREQPPAWVQGLVAALVGHQASPANTASSAPPSSDAPRRRQAS